MNRTGNESRPSVPPQGLKGTDTGNAATSRKSSSSSSSSTRFCSSLALRPPLPPVETTTDDGVVVVGPVASPAPAPTGDSAATSTATDEHDHDHDHEQAPEPFFLARMCVACEVLVLATETRFTALVLLHRYAQARRERERERIREQMREREQERDGSTDTNHQKEDDDDDDDDDWPWIGAACILLACKAEEEPRRLRDVVNVARMVLSNVGSNRDKGNHRGGNGDGNGDGTNMNTNSNTNTTVVVNLTRPPALDDRYWESKQKTIETEQLVLSWLGFDCSVSHPHRAVHQILDRELAGGRVARSNRDGNGNYNGNYNGNGDGEPPNKRARATKDSRDGTNRNHDSDHYRSRNQLLSLAFRRLNDALVYPEALRWGVTELACAALDLAAEDPAQDPVADTHQKHTTTNSIIDSSNTDLGVGTIFRNEWWRRYKVCSERFRGCRNSLREATSRLEAMANANAKAKSNSKAATSRGQSATATATATADPI